MSVIKLGIVRFLYCTN